MTQTDSPQILALKERYKSSFAEKVQMIAEYLLVIESDRVSLESVSELRGFLHKLAGSAGMYGYDDISLASRKAMVCADKVNDLLQVDELISSARNVINLLESNC